MKRFLLLILLVFPLVCLSQNEFDAYGGSYEFNPDNIPCLTVDEKVKIKLELKESINELQKRGKLTKPNTKLIQKFIWPVRKSSGAEFFDVWGYF